jgi:hypothetical protein
MIASDKHGPAPELSASESHSDNYLTPERFRLLLFRTRRAICILMDQCDPFNESDDERYCILRTTADAIDDLIYYERAPE